MERKGRARDKSVGKKKETTKSPRGRPKKSVERVKSTDRGRSRSRGRPKKPVEPKPKRERSRSVSQPRSTRKRTPARSTKRDKSEDNQPIVALKDFTMSGRTLDEIVRRSLSRDVANDVATRRLKKLLTIAQCTKNRLRKKKLLRKKGFLPKRLSLVVGSAPWQQSPFSSCWSYGTLLGCTKEQCLLQRFHIPRNWRVYLNLDY